MIAAVVGGIAILSFTRSTDGPQDSARPTAIGATTLAQSAPPTTEFVESTTPVDTTIAVVTTTTTSDSTFAAADPYGGVATVGVIGPATTLNPFIERSGMGDAVGAITWASAFVLDAETYDIKPGVLSEIPSFENGGLSANDDGSVTVSLRLSQQARWQDGQPITGHDLAFTAALLADDRRVDSDLRELYSMVSGPEAADDTFRFTVTNPSIDYLNLFQVILPRHQVEGTDLFGDWTDRIWVSAGPFIPGAIQSDGSVALRRNPQYRGVDSQGRDLPYLDGLLVVPYLDEAEVLIGLTEKELSVGDLGGGYQTAADRSDLLISFAPGEEWEHVGFQFGSGRFAANPRSMVSSSAFRDLVAVVVGDDELVSEIGGTGLYPTSSIVGSAWPRGAAPDQPEIVEPSLDEIAAELGRDFEEQPPTVVYATTVALDRSQMAGITLRELAARGVAVEPQLQDPGLFFRDAVIEGSFEVAEWAWTVTPGPVGAARDLQSWFGTSPSRDGLDFYRWSTNTESAALVDEIAGLDSIMDLGELQTALQSIDGQLLDLVVVVPLWQTSSGAAYDPRRIDGYDHPRFGVPITWNADLWLVPGGCADLQPGEVCGGPGQPEEAG
ncbi:MAG: ABC transporter substrate-binding protein [Acidimicrobiia bacterium]|nr:ABC transporter substrate-binding protein [Acidimicrobiia bacterium]